MKTIEDRFIAIMSRVDAWAKENAGWDFRGEAEAEVRFCLTDSFCASMSDDDIVNDAILTWSMAE